LPHRNVITLKLAMRICRQLLPDDCAKTTDYTDRKKTNHRDTEAGESGDRVIGKPANPTTEIGESQRSRGATEKQDPQRRGTEEAEDWKETGGTRLETQIKENAKPNHEERPESLRRQSKENRASNPVRLQEGFFIFAQRDRAVQTDP